MLVLIRLSKNFNFPIKDMPKSDIRFFIYHAVYVVCFNHFKFSHLKGKQYCVIIL